VGVAEDQIATRLLGHDQVDPRGDQLRSFGLEPDPQRVAARL
jgi:hypothetical protein